ncbi:hypothetical protein ACTXT7_003978 [Hymenolepis weldensis]
MNLFDIEKLSIKSAIESGGQTEYEYVGDSDSDLVIKRTFSRPGFHVFYIPGNYPRGVPMWRYIGEDICAVTLVNFHPDTDTTLTRLFLRTYMNRPWQWSQVVELTTTTIILTYSSHRSRGMSCTAKFNTVVTFSIVMSLEQ